MKVSMKEIENVSKLKPFERYRYFIKKVADFEEVWTIKDQNDDFALSDIEEYTLVSLWSAEEFIQSNLNEGWKDCVPIKMDLEMLQNELYYVLVKNNYLVNVFPVNGRSGFVVSIEEFIRDLNLELEDYE
ncbi:MAG: DUF2750 domain-containing protein [Bacteroidota bacterium]